MAAEIRLLAVKAGVKWGFYCLAWTRHGLGLAGTGWAKPGGISVMTVIAVSYRMKYGEGRQLEVTAR